MDVAASAVDITSSGIQACQGLLAYYNSSKDYSADITAAYNSIDDLCKTFKLLEETLGRQGLDPAKIERVQQCLGSCMAGVQKLEKKLHKIQTRNVPGGVRQRSPAEVQPLSSLPERRIPVKLCEIVADLGGPLSLIIQVLQPGVGTMFYDTSKQSGIVEEKATFKDDSLNSVQNGFRLLRLLGSSAGQIECELDHVVFGSKTCPRYEALSYTWGSSELVETIRVNSKPLRVTDNLHTLLHHLRLHDRDRVLWIDAICIDQTNIQERSGQVAKMGEIYRHASVVVIWLGKATVEIDFLMQWLEAVRKQDLGFINSKETIEERLRTGVRMLLQRPWFGRVWILQEVANARRAIICAGQQSISAPLFAHAASTLDVKVDPHCSSVLNLMLQTSRIDSRSDLEDLGPLILKFQVCKASDERDKIYALLGMASNRLDTTELSPDYSLAPADVVEKAVRYLFEITQCSISQVLDFLTSFRSVTTVCLVPRSGQDFEDMVAEQTSADTNMQKLLTNRFSQIESEKRASFLCIEQQSSTQDQAEIETCYSQFAQLSAMHRVRLLTWGKFGPSVKILLRAGRGGLLDVASGHGLEKVVSMLIARGAYINAQPGYLDSALQAASSGGHEKVVSMLIARGADVNAPRGYVSYALQLASSGGHEKVVSMLIEGGADINAQGGYLGDALQAASSKGHEKVVSILIEGGADINAQGGYYGNALQAASFGGYEKVVSILITRGANVNTQGGRLSNALQAALSGGHEKLASMLIERGAIVKAEEL